MHLATPEEIESFINAPSGQVNVIRKMERIKIPRLSPLQKEDLLDRQREHWKKLHATRMTPEQFAEWVDAIPGCSTCQKDFKNIAKKVPPRYDDWEKWSWEVHNLVNEKIGKPVFSWQEACELWGWNHEPNEIENAETEDSGTDARGGALREVS